MPPATAAGAGPATATAPAAPSAVTSAGPISAVPTPPVAPAPAGDAAGVSSASLQAVLVQALHNDDRAMLEYCLAVTNPRTVRATVQTLPPTVASAR